MSPTEATKLLDLPADATPERIETRFNELRLKLEDKISHAPTPGLKAKYRESLDEITTAFETLVLASDSSSLPVTRKQEAGSKEQGRSNPSPVGSPLVGGPVPARPEEPALQAKQKSGGKEFLLVAFIAIAVLAAGGWFVMKTRAENEEKARVAAEMKAEAERQAEETRRAAEAERLSHEKELLAMRTQMAELQVAFDSAHQLERSVERELTELRNRARTAPAGKTAEIAGQVLTRQTDALEHYLDWLRATLPGHPASLARARATELVASGVLEPARAGVQAYQHALAKLKEAIEMRAPDLAQIAEQVRGEPILAQWHKVLAEEQKKDREAVSWLPKGATRSSADRDLALLIIDRFGENPAGIPADFPAALSWLEGLCAGGDHRPMLLMADMYHSSERVSSDEDKMWQWRYRAAEAGDPETKYRVASTPYDQYLPWNLETRVRWLRQAAEAGNPGAALALSRYAGMAVMAPLLAGTIEEERKSAAEGNLGAAQQVWSFDNVGKVLLPPEAALHWLKKAVEAGSQEAILELARRHAEGHGVDLDWVRAIELCGRHPDNVNGQYLLAEAHANGWGVEEDQTRAFALYRKVAETTKSPPFILEVARRYAEGHGVARDERKAIEWFRHPNLRGNEEAAAALRNRGLAPNGLPWPEAVRVWQGQPEDGWSLLWLGEAYEHGRGVAQDPVKAAACYTKAAGKHLSEAKFALAQCHLSGKGVPKDLKKALDLFVAAGGSKAAAALSALGRAPNGQLPEVWLLEMKQGAPGNPWMYFLLGEAYEKGSGVSPDPAAAAEWYRQGADLGSAEAMFALGRCLANGNGLARDAAAAAEWFQKAAGNGNGDAMLALGRCYASGTGVPKDEALAIRWTWMAAVRNIPEAKAELRRLRATPSS